MKALLLTPTYFPQLTGNAVTVHRISTRLTQNGIDCQIIDLSKTAGIDLLDMVGTFSPDIIHSFHAYKSGRSGALLKKILGVPLVTTLTGTDINVDLKDRHRCQAIKDVLTVSDLVTVFNDHARSALVRRGIPPEKIRVIHQSVLMEDKKVIDYRSLHGVCDKDKVFLMSGGIRRVKRIGYALDVLETVKKNRPDIRLFIAGLILEQDEFQRIDKRLRHLPWVTYLGQVSRENMVSLLRSVDVVLNTSSSESEANALLEAFFCHRTVIARRIPGNSSLLTDRTGFLFRNKKEFYEKILYVLDHGDKLEPIRREADRLIRTVFSFDQERVAYVAVYGDVVSSWSKAK
jgi:glycosyltransferase involved in cell wall biosynthesis